MPPLPLRCSSTRAPIERIELSALTAQLSSGVVRLKKALLTVAACMASVAAAAIMAVISLFIMLLLKLHC